MVPIEAGPRPPERIPNFADCARPTRRSPAAAAPPDPPRWRPPARAAAVRPRTTRLSTHQGGDLGRRPAARGRRGCAFGQTVPKRSAPSRLSTGSRPRLPPVTPRRRSAISLEGRRLAGRRRCRERLGSLLGDHDQVRGQAGPGPRMPYGRALSGPGLGDLSAPEVRSTGATRLGQSAPASLSERDTRPAEPLFGEARLSRRSSSSFLLTGHRGLRGVRSRSVSSGRPWSTSPAVSRWSPVALTPRRCSDMQRSDGEHGCPRTICRLQVPAGEPRSECPHGLPHRAPRSGLGSVRRRDTPRHARGRPAGSRGRSLRHR